MQLLTRKGVYPYSYFKSFKVFEETCLPPKHEFYNQLTQEHISDEEYEHAKKVFDYWDMKTLWEYHNLYLITDVLILADVFTEFRNDFHNVYGLDVARFVSLPGFSWQANLRLRKKQKPIELMTDINMHLMIENSLRGGVSVVLQRYAKSNVPNTESYDPLKENEFIVYLDKNNLYGSGLMQKLPLSDFAWCSDNEIRYVERNLLQLDPNDEIGYILDVDLQYSDQIHDLTNDMPLAAEKIKVY